MRTIVFALLFLIVAITSCKKTNSSPDSDLTPEEQFHTDTLAKRYGINIKGIKNLELHEVFNYAKNIYASGNIGNKCWNGIFQRKTGELMYQRSFSNYPDTMMVATGETITLDFCKIYHVRENGDQVVITTDMIQKADIDKASSYYINKTQNISIIDIAAQTQSQMQIRAVKDKSFYMYGGVKWFNGNFLFCEAPNWGNYEDWYFSIYTIDLKLVEKIKLLPHSQLALPEYENMHVIDNQNYLVIGNFWITRVNILDSNPVYAPSSWNLQTFDFAITPKLKNYTVKNNVVTVLYEIKLPDSTTFQDSLIKVDVTTGKRLN